MLLVQGARHLTALVSAPASPRYARWDALMAPRQPRSVPAVRAGRCAARPSHRRLDTHDARARRDGEGGTKVHVATIILHYSHQRGARAPAREGVRAAREAGRGVVALPDEQRDKGVLLRVSMSTARRWRSIPSLS
ncbi:hypothetical protein SPHINGOT1_340010 [Sphingomonas sp. T1]|nr:hypothetical protein SPHINGOT1_340010 [Sphingomonas sp. T1]